MAISKEEAAVLNEREITIVSNLVAYIDDYLSRNYVVGQTEPTRILVTNIASSVTPRVAHEVVKQYKAKGWTVVFHPEDGTDKRTFFDFS